MNVRGDLLWATTQHRHNNSANQSTYEGKDQESIQSSTTPDPEHHMENKKPSEPLDVIWTWRWRSQVTRFYDVIVTPKALHFENVKNL